MPCQGPTPAEEYAEYQEQINRVTRAACDMSNILRRFRLLKELKEETQDWIADHAKADAKRIREEQAEADRDKFRQKALAKLTAAEREALDL